MFEHSLTLRNPLRAVDLCDLATLELHLKAAESRVVQPDSAKTQDFGPIFEQIESAVREVQVRVEPIKMELASLAIGLAKRMMEHLVGNSKVIQEQRLEKVINEVLASAETGLAVRLHPDNFDGVTGCFDADTTLERVSFQKDTSVLQGECLVELDSHQLVTSLESQLTEMETRLQELIEDV